MSVIRLMIVDDHCMVREGLRQLLEADKNFKVVAEAENGTKCLKLLSEISFDLLILNLDMPDKDGLDVLKELQETEKKKFKILVLTGHYEIQYFFKISKYAFEGYILKSSEFEELKNAIYVIMNDNIYIQKEIEVQLNFAEEQLKSDSDKVFSLTKRELDVLKNLSFGMYNKEIALKLDISERTVKNHISNIFKKIGVSDRTQAALFSIRNNLVNIYCR